MKNIALASLIALVGLVLPAATAQAQPGRNQISALTVPVAGAGGGATFAGTMQIQRFANQEGQLVATGILSGLVTTASGATTSIVRTVTVPAAVTDATCQILHLDLGPLNLNLLGLQIDLSRIVLDITAQSGAGNLLGNLLCGVANLLNNPGGLAALLNQILGILG
jgi:hypothetical protein